MSLPTIHLPNFTIKLPSNKQEIECRPYLVKEDKILMMAAQEENAKEISQATRKVINSCVVDPPDFDCIKLPSFDVDFLFMSLRAKSVGESVVLELTCNEINSDGETCGQDFDAPLKIEDVKLIGLDITKSDDINLPESSITVHMKYTSYKATLDYNDSDDELTKNIRILYHSIDHFSTGNTVHQMRDTTFDEFVKWTETLTREQYKKLIEYVNAIPYFEIKIEHKCTKCGKEHDMRFNDVLNFF